mgnify:CR=1 FL=1
MADSSSLPPPLEPPPTARPKHTRDVSRDTTATDDDGDTASQKSISLSSPPASPRISVLSDPDPRNSITTNPTEYSNRDSVTSKLSIGEPGMLYARGENVSSSTNTGSVYSDDPSATRPTYPPAPHQDDTASIASFTSSSSKKARPESLLMDLPAGQLVLGVALVDFNHLVGDIACLSIWNRFIVGGCALFSANVLRSRTGRAR